MQSISGGRGARWRHNDGENDAESLGELSVSSSVERQAMREQLDAVRQTLNTLALGNQPNATAPAGLEIVLTDILGKLNGIENLYNSLQNKVDKVDLRMEDSERHIKDLQHISANAIHETARLVEYVGGRATPNTRTGSVAGGGSASISAGAALRARHMAAAAGTPGTPLAQIVTPTRATLEFLPAHVGTTLQQHAAQIHKLIAGLDFLEAHIIRQDQVVEGVQKQLITVARDAVSANTQSETHSPSEVSMKLHDMSELLNKLRAHMYKIERKATNTEQTMAALGSRMTALEERRQEVSSVGLVSTDGGLSEHREPLYRHQPAKEEAPGGPAVSELTAVQEELRNAVLALGRDVLELRDQLAAQAAVVVAQEERQQSGSISQEEAADMRRQLTLLLSHMPGLVSENAELKQEAARAAQQVSELSGAVQRLQQEQTSRITASAAELAAVQQRVAVLESVTADAASLQDVERAAAAAAEANTGVGSLGDTVYKLREQLTVLGERVAEQQQQLQELQLQQHLQQQQLQQELQEQAGTEVAALRERLEVVVGAVSEGRKEDAVNVAKWQESALAGMEAEQAALKQQLADLAFQVSEEQTAISSGLRQVQEEVAAVAAAATEAVACAQQVQQQQESTASQQEADTAQAELRGQVAAVMERLKARVEEGVRQMDTQVLALNEELANAVRAEHLDAALKATAAATAQNLESALQQTRTALAQQLEAALQQSHTATTQQLDSALQETRAATAQQLETALQPLRFALTDVAEQQQLASSGLDGVRSEMVLMTGRQDAVQARLAVMEAAVGVGMLTGGDARSSRLNEALGLPMPPPEEEQQQRVSAAGAAETGQDEREREPGTGEARGEEEGGSWSTLDSREGEVEPGTQAVVVAPAARAVSAGAVRSDVADGAGVVGFPSGGLLAVVAELRARLGGLESAVATATSDMEENTAMVHSELQEVTCAVEQMGTRVDNTAASVEAVRAASQQQLAEQAASRGELIARLEELQERLERDVFGRVQATTDAVASLAVRLSRDYVNREQLGAIFQARSDMKRAVDELASVFDTGRLLRAISSGESEAPAAPVESPPRPPSPWLMSTLEDLAGKQAELEQQVQLALYRTEGAVRQEDLRSAQLAIMTIERQMKRMEAAATAAIAAFSPAPHANGAPVGVVAAVDAVNQSEVAALVRDFRQRLEALEARVGPAARQPARSPQKVEQVEWGQAGDEEEACVREGCVAPENPGGAEGGRSAAAEKEGDDLGTGKLHMRPLDPTDAFRPVMVRLTVQRPSTLSATYGSSQGGGVPAEDDAAPSYTAPSSSLFGDPQAQAVHQLRQALSDLEAAVRAELAAEVAERQLLAVTLRNEVAAETAALRSEIAAEASLRQHLVVSEANERQRLAEAIGDLSERLDSQVNATASTAAMVATMAATESQHHPQHVQVKLRVGPEADVASLSANLSVLTARVEAAEESLSQAFVVPAPRGLARGTITGSGAAGDGDGTEAAGSKTAAEATPAERQADAGVADGSVSEQEGEVSLRPALGLMVPVLPQAAEQQLTKLTAEVQQLTAALTVVGSRVDRLEAADVLEEVRAAATGAVLKAIPGMVSQQLVGMREEVAELVGHQGEQLMELAGHAAKDAAEAVLAVREAVVEAAEARQAVEEGLRIWAQETRDTPDQWAAAEARVREAEVEAAEARHIAVHARAEAELALREALQAEQGMVVERQAAMEAAEAVAQQVAAAAAVRNEARQDDVAETVKHLVAEVKVVREAVDALAERLGDVEALREQLESLEDQLVRTTPSPRTRIEVAAGQHQQPPSTPTAAAVASIFTPAASALMVPPVHTPRATTVGTTTTVSPSRASAATPSSSQHVAILSRLVEVVKNHSRRLHAQYSDAEETGAALAQVDYTVEEAEARLAVMRDANSPDYVETFVAVLEQVAALRSIGSQTHPAVQQMVLEHENRLEQLSEQLQALGAIGVGPVPPQTPPSSIELSTALSARLARLEAEVTRVASHHAALDLAINEILAAVTTASRLQQPSPQQDVNAGFSSTPAGVSYTDSDDASAAITAATMPTADLTDMLEGLSTAGDSNNMSLAVAVVALAAKVQLLDATLTSQQAMLREEIAVAAGSTGGVDVVALDARVAQLHAATAAMRTRVLAVQEYVDSTQGMIKDMHVALGGLHRRVDALDGSSAGGRSTRVSSSGTSGDMEGIRELKSEVTKLEVRLLALESAALEVNHSLAGLKALAPRVLETEGRLEEACTKLAVALGGKPSGLTPAIPAPVPGMSLPALAGSVRTLERRLADRLETAAAAMEALKDALSATGRIQAESTANPFKAISAAVNNPVVVALDKKMESMRSQVLATASLLLDDLRYDHQQQQMEARLAASSEALGSGMGGNSLSGSIRGGSRGAV